MFELRMHWQPDEVVTKAADTTIQADDRNDNLNRYAGVRFILDDDSCLN